MILPVRADEGVDEHEAADEQERIEEEEEIHVAIEACNLRDGRRDKEQGEHFHCIFYVSNELRRDDFLCDARADEGHDIEHDEVEFPPEICHAVDAREEGGGARRPQDEAREIGNEIELHAAAARMCAAPREIHDEEDDERDCDRQARDVDCVGEAEAPQKEARGADHEVVDAAEPVRITRVQHDREAFARQILIEMHVVERAPA